ncbi:MAG: hypothetical protein AAFP87_18585, partial [Pseudomonadota bacterium]
MSNSDDFSSGTLDPVWNIQGPAGISHSLDSDASDAWLELVTPDPGCSRQGQACPKKSRRRRG